MRIPRQASNIWERRANANHSRDPQSTVWQNYFWSQLLPFDLLSTKSSLGFESCNICAVDGSTITNPDYVLAFHKTTCQNLSDSLLSIDSESLKCEQASFDAADCGCPPVSDPCTLCWDASSITKPDKVIDGKVYTCQDHNDNLLGIPNGSGTCHGYRSRMGLICGCPVYEDSCTMCKGGDKMGEPGQNAEMINAWNSWFSGEVGTKMFTCESAENALSFLYQQNDSKCYYNQLLHGQACGCPDNTESITLGWTQRCLGILSLFGSLIIIMSVITKPRNVR